MKLEFSHQIFAKYPYINIMKICPVAAELFHADRHDEANSRFLRSVNMRRKWNMYWTFTVLIYYI